MALAGRPSAQTVTSRGFAEGRVYLYPQTAPNDAARAVADALFRYEPSVAAASWLRINAAFDARIDTHDQVDRRWFIDWQDRTTERPPFSIRRLSATASRGGLNVEIGKQFIRWGKADVLNPIDRFAPRDFLTIVDNEFLGVTGARATYESDGNTVDAVWVPHFTPSRIPLFNQRWAVAPPDVSIAPSPVRLIDAGSRFPAGSQAGLRYNRVGSGYEFSLSFYNGFNHLPLLALVTPPVLSPVPVVGLVRTYPQMRMYGGDFALPNKWVTVKGEAGYFASSTAAADEYGIYVVQVERQMGDWLLVGGYAGDFVTRTGARRFVSPIPGTPPVADVPFIGADRGLARAFLAHATLTLDVNASLVLQAAVRQNGEGTWLQAEYSRAHGTHLRAIVEANVIRGSDADFLGRYHRNSNVNLTLRYSF